MTANPALRKLGLSDNDRVVIFHIDDVGSCQAAYSAYVDLVEFGLISSAAIMVPCPWFAQAAAFCKQHPEVDMGVHLTLNSEWETYRWAPISTCDPATGLIDDEGYFYRRSAPVQQKANPEAVYIELKAQIERALKSGVDATHMDGHMGTVAHARFMTPYLRLAEEYRLPPTLLFRANRVGFQELGADPELAEIALKGVEKFESAGVPLLDHVWGMPLDRHENRIEEAKRGIDALPPGITHFFMHPAHDTPELRAMAPDWRCRVADYEAFMSPELRDYVKNSGVHVIGNRVLRDLTR